MATAEGSTDRVDLQLVGGGRMGEALLAGLLSADDAAGTQRSVRVVEADENRRAQLADAYPHISISADVGLASGTVLAVKPQQIAEVASAVAAAGSDRVLSIAAGVTIAAIEAAVGTDVAVIRAMPNTPSLVGKGAAAIAGGAGVTDDDLVWAESILGSVGLVERVAEPLLDAVTGLSGSGPAYVFVILDAMIEGGVLAGLPRPTAEALAAQTLLGAASLYLEGDASPGELRAQVTSPGGTTAAGLRVLEQRAVRAAMIDAVIAARDRSVELGS